jgi:hypothetical protein
MSTTNTNTNADTDSNTDTTTGMNVASIMNSSNHNDQDAINTSMECGSCLTAKFSPDVKSDDAPIMSQSCDHSACRGCVRQMYLQLVEKHGNTRKWVACPICRKSKAFPGDEEKQNVNRALCEALQIIDQQKKALLQQQQNINSEEQEEKQVAVLVKKEEQDIQEIVGEKRHTDHAHAGAANNTTAEIPSLKEKQVVENVAVVFQKEKQDIQEIVGEKRHTDHAHAGAANNTTTEIPSIKNQEQTRLPIADATSNASSNKPPVGEKKKMAEQSDHEEDNDYLDTLLQGNSRSFGGHAVRHQQVQQEMVLSSEDENENDSSSSERVRVVDEVQQFQHEKVSSDEESENDSSPSPSPAQLQLDAVQQTSGTKRKRRAPIKSFEDRLNDLKAFKAKYGHCDVSIKGEDSSLGQWCSLLRTSYKKIQNHQKPYTKLSDEQIQSLNDVGFKWPLVLSFDDRFNDLMTYKAKYGHCDISKHILTKYGEDPSLGRWCSELRVSTKLSDAQIQRLDDAGFKWSLRKVAKGKRRAINQSRRYTGATWTRQGGFQVGVFTKGSKGKKKSNKVI